MANSEGGASFEFRAVELIKMAGVKLTSGDVALLLLLVCITLLQSGSTEGLTVGFYNDICPVAEATITNAVKSTFLKQ